MAGNNTIQRLPVGLLDLLGMQSTGDTPHTVAAQIDPSLELLDLYLSDRLTAASLDTGGITAIGLFGSLLGPAPGEQWMVYNVTGRSAAALAGATAYTGVLCVSRATGSNLFQMLGTPFACANPGQWAGGFNFERPLIMRPGDTLSFYVSAITGVPNNAMTLSAFYARIRI